jgi:lysophospholipase L1-like esterase
MWDRVTAPRLACITVAVLLVAGARHVAGAPPDAALELDLPSAPARVIFFGSSTTEGSGATARERRWTSLVARRLGWTELNRGLSRSTLTNLGRKVPSGEERWREALAGEPADVVFVMYGANDVLAHVPLGDPEAPGTFRHAAATMLRGMRELLPHAVLVVCTPQPGRALTERREPYDLALAEAAATAGAIFLPAGAAFPEERLGELAADRIHLNDRGHAVLADFVAGAPALAALHSRLPSAARASAR